MVNNFVDPGFGADEVAPKAVVILTLGGWVYGLVLITWAIALSVDWTERRFSSIQLFLIGQNPLLKGHSGFKYQMHGHCQPAL